MTKPGSEQIFYHLEEIQFSLIAMIVVGTLAAILLLQRWLPWIADRVPPRFRSVILPLGPLFRLILLFISLSTIVPLVIRPTLQNLLAVFGAAGLAIGFAFKDYASSLIAGVIAIYEVPYRPGDRVTIGGVYGEVLSLDLRAVRIVTPDDSVVTIPHAKIWTENIFNANDGHREQLCVADFFLHPEHDGIKVRQKLRDVALVSPFTQLHRPIAVVCREKPWGTHYRLKAYPIDGRDEFPFVTDLTVRGKQALSGIGVQLIHLPYAPASQKSDS